MNRRNLLKGAGVIALYGSFPAVVSNFLSSCQSRDKLNAVFFNTDEFASLENIVDILLPRTTTPGGIDTKTPFFIDKVVNDCLSPDNQQLIRKGMQELSVSGNQSFTSLSADEKKQLIEAIDQKAFANDDSKTWFRIIKKLALIGHFTSREGMTTALNYVKVPDYQACIPYKEGDKAMAKTFLLYW